METPQLGNVVQKGTNEKEVVRPNNIERITAEKEQYTFICERPHQDKDYSYVCWSKYGCMCMN